MTGAQPARPVVLTPGYEDDARKVRRLVARVHQAGRAVLALSPQPSDGTVPIEVLAQRLAEQVDDTLGPATPFDFFGFSMGGLIGRVYLQQLGGSARVRRFVTLATPHRGTWSAHFVGGKPAVAQMRTGSPFLAALNADPAHLDAVRFTALWTPLDLSITPAHHAFLPGRPHQVVYSPFHGTLLMDPFVLDAVVRALGD
jgi:triacylglycerol lipase